MGIRGKEYEQALEVTSLAAPAAIFSTHRAGSFLPSGSPADTSIVAGSRANSWQSNRHNNWHNNRPNNWHNNGHNYWHNIGHNNWHNIGRRCGRSPRQRKRCWRSSTSPGCLKRCS